MDQNQIRLLYEQYGTWVFNRAKGFLKNDESAWEATQDVFVKIMESGDHFRGEASPWTWIYRITTNHCLNLIRSRKIWNRVSENLTKDQISLGLHVDDGPAVLIDRKSFVQLLQVEDDSTQKILLAYYLDDMTQEEIAQMLQVSRKTVYKKLQAFFKKAKGKI